MDRGWIRSYRKKVFSDLWANKNAYRVFEWLLHSATHRPHKYFTGGVCIEMGPGEFVSSERVIAKHCFISYQQTRTALAYLKSTHRITQRATHKYSVYSIIKWDIYQNPDGSNNADDEVDGNAESTQYQRSDNAVATQKQELKNERIRSRADTLVISSSSDDPPENGFSPKDMMRLWNEGVDFYAKGKTVLVPKILKLTPDRRKKAASRIKDCNVDEARWREVINAVHQSEFLSGERTTPGHPGWAASFDFVIRSPAVMMKIVEGGYR